MHAKTRSAPQLERRPDGTLYVVTGASRTGKTTWVAERVASARRLLVWDSVGEWGDRFNCTRVDSVFQLAQLVKPGAPARRLAFASPVTADNFAAWCRLAWVYLRADLATLVVEELSDVTSPGKAPTPWGEIIRKGLRYGPEVYALTQRPSESDKTSIGNASVLHVHAMARVEDAAYMARELRGTVAEVDSLMPFEWIERDRRTHSTTRGKLRAPRKRK
jgi:hypothetical protein